MAKGCKGCDTIDICGIIIYEEVDECPCGICLVKGICNTMCDDYTRLLIMVANRFLKIQPIGFNSPIIYKKDHV